MVTYMMNIQRTDFQCIRAHTNKRHDVRSLRIVHSHHTVRFDKPVRIGHANIYRCSDSLRRFHSHQPDELAAAHIDHVHL